ncbi:hypothetical protein JNB03_25910 [Klebsiella oxytoca]|nr:hypothetical protein [Klebsiella oxytoca]MBL6251287.1 hypothetical protein [Klebsiella oxytoca]MBL6273902.1 hypothetical protein [Klebsiella oxytoca]
MPVGIFVCSGSLLVGAIFGASLNRFIPEHLKKTLPLIAGLISIREGANKQVISSQADSLIKISRIWADFFPANTSNQPI